jgi:hypothetical protein
MELKTYGLQRLWLRAQAMVLTGKVADMLDFLQFRYVFARLLAIH